MKTNPKYFVSVSCGTLALAAFSQIGCAQTNALPANATATKTVPASGIVYEDANGNNRRDANEKGIPNIGVSNGLDIVQTDANGRYQLSVDDDTAIFVLKPRGWMTPINENKLPRFYYIHKPAGSPQSKFPGVAPTGPLPASIDFALHRQNEPDKFRAVLFADPQPRDEKEVDYVAHDVVEELIGTDATFGVSLGDIAFNNLSVYDSLNQKIALIGIPWYNVIGNHDLNQDSPDDEHSDETFERTFGPPYYSFDYGPTHFVVLDDVVWDGTGNGYHGGLGPKQLEWIKNDLARIPREQMVVLMMHIPLVSEQGKFEASGGDVIDRRELYRLIEQRPFSMSISGHTHYQEHHFITKADGWQGPQPHHHVVNVTVSGSWWSGIPDEQGIPHTMMRDGAPNGYSFITFDGTKYSLEYKAARQPANHQMNIFAPEEVSAADAAKSEVVVNVFAGSSRSKVEMRLGTGAWSEMQRVEREDPYYAGLKEREAKLNLSKKKPDPVLGRALPATMISPHLWAANLPAGLKPGTLILEVRTTDMFGQVYTDRRIIKVL